MKSVLNVRRMFLAAAIVAAVVMATSLSANELNDGTITIPRSGKEIVSLPSPEAAELCRHIDHAIDYSTGCVSLSFPLYTYDCGGISLPISISYRTGGIKADAEPGALGVGWELNCGGFVSRSVVGMPDDAPNVKFVTEIDSLSNHVKLYNYFADAMYDRYSFSAGGYSGSFIINERGAIQHLTPTDALVVRTASGFDITTPDGALYRYDISETLYYQFEPSVYTNATRTPNYNCNCMWRLSEIVSPSRNDIVTFTYESVDGIDKHSSQSTIGVSWERDIWNTLDNKKAKWLLSNSGSLKSIATHSYRNRHRIASISGRGGSVTFSYNATNSERCTGMIVKNNQDHTVRKVSFGSGRTLSSYRVTDDASNLLDGADFTYFANLGNDKQKDFFGYRNGGGVQCFENYDPCESALDKLLRPSWKRQPVLGYTRSESLRSVSTVAGTKTEFEYELNDGGYFLGSGRISPGLRLKEETVTDHVTGNVRTRSLTYSKPAPSVDFSALREEDYVSVSGMYRGTTLVPYEKYTTGATLAVSCRLQGAAPENACVYYGLVTETITGTGIDVRTPIVTDYEYDTTNACSQLYIHTNELANDMRVAGIFSQSDGISTYDDDDTPGDVYDKLLTTNHVRGYFKEIIGERAPLNKVTHWRTFPTGEREIWCQTEYHNSRSTYDYCLGMYSETILRVGGGDPDQIIYPDTHGVFLYDFRSVYDFNRFKIDATSVKVYVDSITETEYDELGTAHTVIKRMGYNNHQLKWKIGKKKLVLIPLAYDFQPKDSVYTYLPDPKIANLRTASNSLPNACIVCCGDEWIRADYIYSSTSDTPQMRLLDNGHLLSLPVETYYTTGHGFEYDSTAVSERFTYVNGRGTYDMRLASDVIRSKTDGAWYTLDSIAVSAYDSYGNPLLVRRNGGTPSYYGWAHSGTTLSFAATSGQKTTYTWEPLIGCTSAKSPSGLTTGYTYSGSRLSAVTVGGSLAKAYNYAVYGISPGNSSGYPPSNYVSEETVINADLWQCVVTDTYFDGFGNRIGNVSRDKGWNTVIATRDDYDAAGRLIRSYTPRPEAFPFHVPTAENPSGDAVPYSVITYSGSSDSRPLSATIAGEEYRGHPSQTRHLFSRAHNGVVDSVLTCRRYRPGATSGAVTLAGYYPKGALSVEEVTDGDGRRALTFTDYRGRLILTRSLMDAGIDLKSVQPGRWTDTYNVYDDAGNLLCVITPAVAPEMSAVGSTWSADDGDSSPLAQCFSYEFDGSMRLRSKKAPDAAAVKYWYDATGAQVLSQDGSQRSRGVCSFAIADSLGRAAVSGECTFSDALAAEVESRHVVATRGTGSGHLNGYIPNITLSSSSIFSSSYYDDYSFLSLSSFSRLSRKLSDHSLPTHKASPVGLPTGTWTRVLGAVSKLSGMINHSDSDKYINDGFDLFSDSLTIVTNGYLSSTMSALCYDNRDRLIATATSDHLGGLCLDTSTLNDGGMPLTKSFKRWPLFTSEAIEDHKYTYVYDNMGRVASLTLTRGDSVYTVQSNAYDAIGRLTRTGYGNGCGISFGYKAAGAMASITAANAAGTNTFSQTLNYATGDTPSYSGNIGSIDWHGYDNINRHYGFTYDGLGRLIAADYSSPSESLGSIFIKMQPSYSTSYTYGLDSRPLTVCRQGVCSIYDNDDIVIPFFGKVDDLTFSYTGSQLTKVYDAADPVIYAGATDFNDGTDLDTEYTYDEDGRLTSDANKGITSIRYNAIGLPAEVTFNDGTTLTNRYGADGTLLQRVKTEQFFFIGFEPITPLALRPITQTYIDDHIGTLTFDNRDINYKYARRKLARIDTPNGFIASGKMHYYVKDYQGNVRQVTDADGVVKQDNHYYPYGMLMGESSNILASARGYKSVSFNPYLFGSKEYLTTGSANLLDFTARTYDPTTLLFLTPDPQATNYTSLNSYLYCGSNPINRVDPSGMECHSFQEDSTMQKFANNYPDDNVINIASHGNSNLLSYKKDNEDFKIKTADKLIEEINKLFKLAQGDVLKLEFIEIRLFACYSGTDDESSGKSLAQIFSEGFPNAVIYGADDKLGLKADGTYVNMSEKKTYWRAFHKGKEISLSEIGNIKQRLHYDKLLLLTPQLNNFKDSLSKAKPKL